VAERLDLSHAIVTGAVTDALPGVIARRSASRRLRGPAARARNYVRRLSIRLRSLWIVYELMIPMAWCGTEIAHKFESVATVGKL
jgi:hypothetical protein